MSVRLEEHAQRGGARDQDVAAGLAAWQRIHARRGWARRPTCEVSGVAICVIEIAGLGLLWCALVARFASGSHLWIGEVERQGEKLYEMKLELRAIEFRSTSMVALVFRVLARERTLMYLSRTAAVLGRLTSASCDDLVKSGIRGCGLISGRHDTCSNSIRS